MINEIVNFDSKLFIFLNNLGTTNFDFIWIGLSKTEFNIIVYLIILIIYIKSNKLNLSNTIQILFFIAILITLADQSSNISKDFFQRLRPCYNDSIIDSFRLVKDTCGGKYGFFSAHASNSFSLAVFFGLLVKEQSNLLIYFFSLIALLISYSRIYLGVHYPADILVGAAFGIINGILIYRTYLYSINTTYKS